MVALIERQELGGRAVQPGRHVDFAIADGEMHQRPAGERQQRLGGLALRSWDVGRSDTGRSRRRCFA